MRIVLASARLVRVLKINNLLLIVLFIIFEGCKGLPPHFNYHNGRFILNHTNLERDSREVKALNQEVQSNSIGTVPRLKNESTGILNLADNRFLVKQALVLR